MTEHAKGGLIGPDVKIVLPDNAYVISGAALAKMRPKMREQLVGIKPRKDER